MTYEYETNGITREFGVHTRGPQSKSITWNAKRGAYSKPKQFIWSILGTIHAILLIILDFECLLHIFHWAKVLLDIFYKIINLSFFLKERFHLIFHKIIYSPTFLLKVICTCFMLDGKPVLYH